MRPLPVANLSREFEVAAAAAEDDMQLGTAYMIILLLRYNLACVCCVGKGSTICFITGLRLTGTVSLI
jgi:hypothetical protein